MKQEDKEIKKLKSPKMAVKYINEAVNVAHQWAKDKAMLDEKIKKGLLTNKGYNEKINQLKDKLQTSLREQNEAVLNQIEKDRVMVGDVLKSGAKKLTPEDIEVLNFLANMKTLTADDLISYQKQFEDNSLALRRIDEIAEEKNLMVPPVADKQSESNSLFTNISNTLNSFTFQKLTSSSSVSGDVNKVFKENFINEIKSKAENVGSLVDIQVDLEDVKTTVMIESEEDTALSFQDQLRQVVSEYNAQ